MLELVITGGQTGADVCGWIAARRCGLDCGGWMPAGWLTEEGPKPAYGAFYGAKELPRGGYPQRTRANVEWADAVLWYGSTNSPGGRLTIGVARELGKPTNVIAEADILGVPMVADWIAGLAPTVLMIAGNRASKTTIPDAAIVEHLMAVFGRLGHPPIARPGD